MRAGAAHTKSGTEMHRTERSKGANHVRHVRVMDKVDGHLVRRFDNSAVGEPILTTAHYLAEDLLQFSSRYHDLELLIVRSFWVRTEARQHVRLHLDGIGLGISKDAFHNRSAPPLLFIIKSTDPHAE